MAELKLRLANYDNVVRKQKAKILKSTEDLNRADGSPSKEQLLKQIENLKFRLKAAEAGDDVSDKSTSVKFLKKMIEVRYNNNNNNHIII